MIQRREKGASALLAPLMISTDNCDALPLFDSAEKARMFLYSNNFGPDWKPVETSVAILESCRDRVEYVTLNSPTREGDMKVKFGHPLEAYIH